VVNPNGTIYDITGGTTAGTNLFHSFQRFGLSTGEVAKFFSDPAIANIFGRVVGGEASIIDGLIQATPNLYLMNPAGIVFGPNASLNVGGDFVATTANQIGFTGDRWFNAFGSVDYTNLLGAPVSFVFTENNGVIINQGNLEVGKNKAIAFLGSGAVSVGSLTAPDGVIAIASVPGTGLVRLSQPGSLLSYEFEPQPGQMIGTHDVGALVSGAVGVPQELPSGSTVVSGSVSAATSEARGLDITMRDLTAAGGITAQADRNVLVDGDISATGDVRLLGDRDGIDGGSLVVTNAEIRTGGGDFEGRGIGTNDQGAGITIQDSLVDSGTGNIRLTGRGAERINVGDNYGLAIARSNIQSSEFGNILLSGIGGRGVDINKTQVGFNYGIFINSSHIRLDGFGDLSVEGTGGHLGWSNYGLRIHGGSVYANRGSINLQGHDVTNLNLGTKGQRGVNIESTLISTSIESDKSIEIIGSSLFHLGMNLRVPTFRAGSGGIVIDAGNSSIIGESPRFLTYRSGDITLIANSTVAFHWNPIFRTENGNLNIDTKTFTIYNDGNSSFMSTGSGNINIRVGRVYSYVDFLTQGGDINFQSILIDFKDSSWITNGGNVQATTINLDIDSINTSSDLGSGNISIISTGDLKINDSINSSSLESGGNVFIDAGYGLEISNNINTSSLNSRGGDIFVRAQGRFSNRDLKIGGFVDSSGGTFSGDISLNSGQAMQIDNYIQSAGRLGSGDIFIAGMDSIQTNDVISDSFTDAGNITITGGFINGVERPTGNVDTTGGIISAAGGNNGGDIKITARGNITTGTVTTFNPGFNGDGGSILLSSSAGDIDTTNGDLITASASGNGGDITLSSREGSFTEIVNGAKIVRIAGGHLYLGDINAQSITAQGGSIELASDKIINPQGDIATNDNSLILGAQTQLASDVTFSVTDNPHILGDSNITFEQTLDGNYNLTLEATTVNLNDSVGNTDPLNQLTVNGTLTNTTTNATQITTHETIRTGDITSQELIHLRSLNADIQTGNLTTPKDVVLDGQHIQTGNISTDTRLTIAPPQTLTTGHITAPTIDPIQTQGDLSTGNIITQNPLTLTSNQGDLSTGNITASGQDVTLTAPQDIATGFIDTSHPTTGGNVQIDGGHNVRIDGTFTDRNNTNASISTAGADTSGAIAIQHGGDGAVPFRVGDARVNGSSGAIARGTHADGTINPGNDYRYTHRQDQDQIAIISRPAPPPTPNSPTPPPRSSLNTPSTPPLAGQNPLENLAYLIGTILNAETVITRDASNRYAFTWEVPDANSENDSTILNASAAAPGFALSSLPSLGIGLNPSIDLGLGQTSNDLVSDIDQFLEEQYEEYFEDEDKVPVTAASVRHMLKTIEQQTSKRSVVLYALNRPNFLQLLLIVPDGPPISKTVPLVTSSDIGRTVSRFRNGVSSVTRSLDYLQPAQQLYDWLIRPYKDTLNNLNVDTLIFSMDAGLRSIPLAALHDGERFLVEQYSVGMIPSVSLTNSQYAPLQDAQVLAMGASEFQHLPPLPAVPLELEAIAQLRNSGTPFLNQAFTLDALRVNSRDRDRSIIHLATHAKFLPIQDNGVNNSSIQLWDQAANFRDLRSLNWHNEPQVELLVLSACETALGDPRAELGFAGLAVQTGVKSALASLWKVSDVGTLGLMASFYEHLNDPDITIKAEALRQAQLALLRGEVSIANGRIGEIALPAQWGNAQQDLSHPFFWSGFTLVGSPW
jgi:filamentous hemagglutinin family protein